MDNMEEKYFLTRGKAILFGVLLIVIIVVIAIIKGAQNNSDKKYKDFELELKSAAENYVIITNLSVDEGEEIRINKKKLNDFNLIYNELKNKCEGYVIVTNEKNLSTDEYELTYLPYIRCSDKYITSNYSEY